MSVTFLHTADWQLGKPFARVADELKRSLLQHERLAVLARMGAAAREAGARWIVVAGDLFDSPTAGKSCVSSACAAVGALGLPVFAIPGNHDHGGPGCLWEQPYFLQEREKLAPHFRVLLTPEPLVLEDAVLLPCPLDRRHVATDPMTWVRRAVRESSAEWGARPRIVLAHGSVQGFSSAVDDEEGGVDAANRLDLAALPMDEIDYVALGDWHGCRQVGSKGWYSGTPEPDRFPKGDQSPGRVLVVTALRGHEPEVRPVTTGRIGWHAVTASLLGDEAVTSLESRLRDVLGERVQQDVVRLELDGALGLDALARLEELLETLEARVLRLRRHHRVVAAPTAEEAASLARREGDPLVSRVAARLLAMMETSAPEAEVARLALRRLHLVLQPAALP